jgi:DNA-binding CsgD family transcriptional regulator
MDVTLQDISRVIRLVQEVCDRWDEPRAWREYLLHGACALLGGTVGTMMAHYDGKRDAFGRLGVVAVVGLPAPLKERLQPAVSRLDSRGIEEASDSVMPAFKPLLAELLQRGWVTASREELTDEATYHASPMYRDLRRPMDCDDFLVSIRIVDVPERAESIDLYRPHGAEPFGAREVALLKILHDEVAPLVGVRLATEDHLSREGLSKRLRETLALLLDGRSEKEAAGALHLGSRTVHDYVTALYQHFHVSSRAELLAYFIRRQPIPRDGT